MSREESVLGRPVRIGSMYNASTGNFIPQTIFLDPTHAGDILPYGNSNVKVMIEENDSDKYSLLDVKGFLMLGVALGLVNVEGSARYLTEQKKSERTVRGSIAASFISVIESVTLNGSEFQGKVDVDALRNPLATHFVSSITWGGKAIISVSSSAGDSRDRNEIKGSVQAACRRIAGCFEAAVDVGVDSQGREDQGESSYSFDLKCDCVVTSVPKTFDEAKAVLSSVSTKIFEQNDGKGVPLTVILEPISTARESCGIASTVETRIVHMNDELIEEVSSVLDQICLLRQKMDDVKWDVFSGQLSNIVADGDEVDVRDQDASVQSFVHRSRAKIGEALTNVLDERDCDVWDDLSDALTAAGTKCRRHVADLSKFYDRCGRKARIIDSIAARVPSLHVVGKKERDDWRIRFVGKELYVFQYGDDTVIGEYLLHAILILSQTLGANPNAETVLLDTCVDCNCSGGECRMPHGLHHFGIDGSCRCHDLVAERRQIHSTPSVQRVPGTIVREGTKPADAVPVLMPCPQSDCSCAVQHRWSCRHCCDLKRTEDPSLYYSKGANVFSCGCGSYPVASLSYRCSDIGHGPEFVTYGSNLFDQLEQQDNRIVVVIMGGTGVGKSTFINALANYLAAASLAEMAKKEVIALIHSVFQMNGRTYSIGTPDADGDGLTGMSMTQKPRAYSFLVDGYIVEIVDSPGIGDTRGHEQDKQNMHETLTFLNYYPYVNAFLFLMNPDDTRLSTAFEYCFNDFVSRLHGNAVDNIIFVYPRARDIWYNLGNSNTSRLLGVHLDALQQRNGKKLLRPTSSNQFLFENDSFKFLVAKKFGCAVDTDAVNTFAKGWEHSSRAARNLFRQIQSLKRHDTKETLAVHRIRTCFMKLLHPMTQISLSIATSCVNIDIYQKQVNEYDIMIEGFNKEPKLKVTYVETVNLTSHSTICLHYDCYKPMSSLGGTGAVPAFTRFCHSNCKLAPVMNHPNTAILQCQCFGGNGTTSTACSVCGHTFEHHLHTTVWYEQRVREEVSNTVLQGLKDAEALKKAKSDLITSSTTEKLRLEVLQKTINNHAANLVQFLQKNPILPFSDAIGRMLQQDIDRQEAIGGDPLIISRLKANLQQFEEEKRTIVLESAVLGTGGAVTVADVEKIFEDLSNLNEHGPKFAQAIRSVGRMPDYGVITVPVLGSNDVSKGWLSYVYDKGKSLGMKALDMLAGGPLLTSPVKNRTL
jgi:GTP-binding protein EngB required for normal cell division